MEDIDVFDNLSKDFASFTNGEKRLLMKEVQHIKKRMDMIKNNQQLYRMYMKYTKDGMQFDTIDEAINNYHKDGVLVYFAEIDKYGIYDYEDYLSLNRFIHDKIKDEDEGMPTIENPKQIILSDSRQKLVILCSGDNSEKIHDRAREFFECDVRSINNSHSEIEIVIDGKILASYDDAFKAFQEFYAFLYKNQKSLSEHIKMPYPHHVGDKKYIQTNIPISQYIHVEDLLKVLTTAPFTGSIQIVINNGTINGSAINNMQQLNEKKIMLAADWIKNNPPINGESTSVYHRRWEQATGYKLDIRDFNRQVSTQNYVNKKTSKCQVWIPSI